MIELYPFKFDTTEFDGHVSRLNALVLEKGSGLEVLLPLLDKLPDLVLIAICLHNRMEGEYEAGFGEEPSPDIANLVTRIRESGLIKATSLYKLNR